MKELVEKINALFADFAAEAAKNVEGNKATLELEKLGKSYRKESVK